VDFCDGAQPGPGNRRGQTQKLSPYRQASVLINAWIAVTQAHRARSNESLETNSHA
jgi:hypothetical protein